MTLKRFIRKLQAIEAKHGGRAKICVDKPTFTHSLEDSDGVCILDVQRADAEHVYQSSEDGGIDHNRDGTERTLFCVVLRGDKCVRKGKRCQGCAGKAEAPHTCPYQEEINMNAEIYCNCCDECRHNCMMEI